MIYSYQKRVSALRTVELELPADGSQRLGTELATLDGVTYVFIPDAAKLPPQPPDIAPAPVTLTPALVKALKARSPHARLINARVVEKIRERYSLDEELALLRGAALGQATADELQEYSDYVAVCRAWGREGKAALGL